MFTGWIYDHLKPHAAALMVAHPLKLRAIAAAWSRRRFANVGARCATPYDTTVLTGRTSFAASTLVRSCV